MEAAFGRETESGFFFEIMSILVSSWSVGFAFPRFSAASVVGSWKIKHRHSVHS